MTNGAEDDPLLDLAAKVTDVTRVDWRSVEEELDTDDARSLMPEFELLATVGTVARLDEPLPDEDPGVLALKPGDIWGRFRLEEVIGHGSYGTVYRAKDPVLDRDVALKLFHSRPTDNSESQAQRALDEARLLSRISHENVVRVIGTEAHRSRVGLWMELVTGRNLDDLIKSHGPYSADEARTIGAALCRALAAVHGAGFLHQDLKAANVLRAEGGRIVLTDLGAGIRLSAAVASDQPRVGGTPLYLAPEIFDGERPSPASDVYSLGVLLFHLVTNRYPVEGSDRIEIERAHRTGRRLRLRDARPDLPGEFVQAVERAIAPNARDRYQTAGEFDAALAVAKPAKRTLLWLVPGILAAVAIAIALVRGATTSFGSRPEGLVGTTVAVTSAGAVASGPQTQGGPFRVRAAFYRRRETGDELLQPGQPLALNDTVALKVNVSAPVFVYVLNQDEQGAGYLLYPLAERLADVSPLPAGEMQLPRADVSNGWVLNSRGGREHFLVAVSRDRLTDFEREIEGLPRPQFNATAPRRLSETAARVLRGAGGLAAPKVQVPSLFPFTDALPLDTREESANGPWLRLITFDNH